MTLAKPKILNSARQKDLTSDCPLSRPMSCSPGCRIQIVCVTGSLRVSGVSGFSGPLRQHNSAHQVFLLEFAQRRVKLSALLNLQMPKAAMEIVSCGAHLLLVTLAHQNSVQSMNASEKGAQPAHGQPPAPTDGSNLKLSLYETCTGL